MPHPRQASPMSIITRGPHRSASVPMNGLSSPAPWLSATSDVMRVSGTSRPRARAGPKGYAKRRAVFRTRRASAEAASSTTSRRPDRESDKGRSFPCRLLSIPLPQRGRGPPFEPRRSLRTTRRGLSQQGGDVRRVEPAPHPCPLPRGERDEELDVLRQELRSARPRQLGAGLVIAAALVAAEPVPGSGIDVHGQVGLRGPDARVVLGRDGLVRLAEMEEHGTARRLRGGVGHAAPVVADGGPDPVDARGSQPGQGAAQAIADYAHLEALARLRLHGGADVLDHVVHVDLAADAAAELDVLRLVAGLEAALGAIEDGRSQRHVALRGEAVGHLLDVAVDAEDLLDDDEPALRGALGGRPVARELVAVFRCQRDHFAHAGFLRRSARGGPAFKGGSEVRATSYLSRGGCGAALSGTQTPLERVPRSH